MIDTGFLSNRRYFIQTSAATIGVLSLPRRAKAVGPNSMLSVACIGVGGRGGKTMQAVASHPQVKITALCDVDSDYLDQAANQFPDAVRYRDWRELLASPENFDAVTVGTPDHMHAAPAVTAIRAKKHLYLEKPMAPTLHECRVITKEASIAGVVTQLGNQFRSSIESRITVEMLRAGAIGKVKEAIMWENKPLVWWPKNTELRTQSDKIPSTLDWDLWLGVRDPRPYMDAAYHPRGWRAWFDFGCGGMGDMGCHHFDTTFDAIALTAPLRVRQLTPGSVGPLWQQQRVVELEFPGTKYTSGPTFKVTWHDGDCEPDRSKIVLPSMMKEFPKSGTFWIGEEGSLFKTYGAEMPILLPGSVGLIENFTGKVRPQDHHHDWVDAILEGRDTCGAFAHGGPLTEAVLVGAMAERDSGKWLDWDREKMEFIGNADLSGLVKREYRDGWKVPGLG